MKPTSGILFKLVLWTLLELSSTYSIRSSTPSDSVSLLRERRSGVECNKDGVESLAISANEICSKVEAVDKYISNVHARDALSVPTFDDRHGFQAILSQYNLDLGKAKEHCQPWRSGDDVVGSLKETVVAAQGFGPRFDEELLNNQGRIKNLLENHEDIATVETKIASLQKEIDEAKEAIKFTNVTTVVTHLEDVIRTKEQEINTTMTEHNIVQGRRELSELVNYLEFVKTGAGEVESKATTANTKLTRFRENIVKDSTAFERHRGNAQEGIKKLQEEETNNNNEIDQNTQSINDLRAKINEENNQIASLNAQIDNANREIKEIEDRINRSLDKTKSRRRFASWFRWIPVIGWTAGNVLYSDAKRTEKRLAEEKRNFVKENARTVQNLRNHIATRQRDIDFHESQIIALQTKSQQLEQELAYFGQLDGNLKSMEEEVNAILPSLTNAITETGKMRSIFEAIKLSLGSTIEKAKEAKTEAEIQNVKYFVYNEIENLKCNWESAKDRIALVGKCN